MKKVVFMIVVACAGYTTSAQSLKDYSKERVFFQHLDASVTLGSTGIGLDLSSPISNHVNLRAGFDFMPHFHHNMSFGVQVGDDPAKSESKFQKLSGFLENMTGYKVDNQIDMVGEPTMYNFKLLVDVFPLKNNKKWHITAGFYIGSSKIAKAYNTTEDMPSLMAVGIYNNMYDKILAGEPLFEDTFLPYEMEEKVLDYGRMGIHVGDYSHDIYDDSGQLLHAKGDPYMMEPDENGMAKATVKVNSFKPYLGIGYGGRLFKNSDKYHIAVDCGVLLWGGTPSIITHDGTDMVHDLENIKGKVGDYIDLLTAFKVYPVLNVRFTKSLF
jgi:hypothetical protein